MIADILLNASYTNTEELSKTPKQETNKQKPHQGSVPNYLGKEKNWIKCKQFFKYWHSIQSWYSNIICSITHRNILSYLWMNQLIQFFFSFSDSVKSTAVSLNMGFIDWINQTTHSFTESAQITHRNANRYFRLKMSGALLLCYMYFWNARSLITEINGI